MNPLLHDEFVALTALHFAGELDDEEAAHLQVHLAFCDPCRRAFEEFEEATCNAIPAMAAGAAANSPRVPQESAASFEAAEHRLMSHLESAWPEHKTPATATVIPWKIVTTVLAASSIGIAGLIGARHLKQKVPSDRNPQPIATQHVPVSPITDGPRDNLQRELESAQQQVASLQQEKKLDEGRYLQEHIAAMDASQQLQTERSAKAQAAAERDVLNQQLASVQADLQSVREKSAMGHVQPDTQAARMEALENQVHLLNATLIEKETSIDEKDRMLALDKDFLGHDRDIRDLIGARNLYIADIIDMGPNGKTAKPFGRIFYTKDRSLVFYGFDLDKQAGLTQAVAFQAWGTGSDKQTVNLGLFYQDDSHKRWVLRCNDSKALTRLNMVYVTVEPPGGSNKPTGKPLLRAYLQIDPNHP